MKNDIKINKNLEIKLTSKELDLSSESLTYDSGLRKEYPIKQVLPTQEEKSHFGLDSNEKITLENRRFIGNAALKSIRNNTTISSELEKSKSTLAPGITEIIVNAEKQGESLVAFPYHDERLANLENSCRKNKNETLPNLAQKIDACIMSAYKFIGTKSINDQIKLINRELGHEVVDKINFEDVADRTNGVVEKLFKNSVKKLSLHENLLELPEKEKIKDMLVTHRSKKFKTASQYPENLISSLSMMDAVCGVDLPPYRLPIRTNNSSPFMGPYLFVDITANPDKIDQKIYNHQQSVAVFKELASPGSSYHAAVLLVDLKPSDSLSYSDVKKGAYAQAISASLREGMLQVSKIPEEQRPDVVKFSELLYAGLILDSPHPNWKKH
jgi:hypothetical protein